jgi:hypothetical protein
MFKSAVSAAASCTSCTTTCAAGSQLLAQCSAVQDSICVPCATAKYKTGSGAQACADCTATCNHGFELTGSCTPVLTPTCNSCGTGKFQIADATTAACFLAGRLAQPASILRQRALPARMQHARPVSTDRHTSRLTRQQRHVPRVQHFALVGTSCLHSARLCKTISAKCAPRASTKLAAVLSRARIVLSPATVALN